MIRPMRRTFAGLRHSVSFRLTLNYGLLAILTTVILLVFIYFQMMGALWAQQSQQINGAAQRLSAMFDHSGRAGVIAAIELTLSDQVDSDREVYLLLDEFGHKLAGNLEASFSLPSYMGIFEASAQIEGTRKTGYFRAQRLHDGAILIVGQDSEAIELVSGQIVQGILASILLAMVLVGIGTYIFRRELEYRVSAIRWTARKISAGQLSQRVPPSLAEDEFTLLTRDINTMLDKIEVLMNGVRHVSDTIAHNLRTPLMRIVGRLRNTQRKGCSLEASLQANLYAIEEIENLNALFGKLLQIAEIEAGVRRQAFQLCRLDLLVADVVDMYSALAEERGVHLEYQALAGVRVNGDADLLASATANLLDNAIKYASRQVWVDVALDGDNIVRVTLRDDGAGLPEGERERVGERFYRIDSDVQGHGLGLASVRAIVAMHDGELELSDASPGQKRPGLKVEIILAVAACDMNKS